MKNQTPNAKRVAAYQKRQSEKVARMKAALEEIAKPLRFDEPLNGYGKGFNDALIVSARIARQALAPTDGRGEG